MSTLGNRRKRGSIVEAFGCCGDGRQEKRTQDVRSDAGEE